MQALTLGAEILPWGTEVLAWRAAEMLIGGSIIDGWKLIWSIAAHMSLEALFCCTSSWKSSSSKLTAVPWPIPVWRGSLPCRDAFYKKIKRSGTNTTIYESRTYPSFDSSQQGERFSKSRQGSVESPLNSISSLFLLLRESSYGFTWSWSSRPLMIRSRRSRFRHHRRCFREGSSYWFFLMCFTAVHVMCNLKLRYGEEGKRANLPNSAIEMKAPRRDAFSACFCCGIPLELFR